jgi:hypothetical protein
MAAAFGKATLAILLVNHIMIMDKSMSPPSMTLHSQSQGKLLSCKCHKSILFIPNERTSDMLYGIPQTTSHNQQVSKPTPHLQRVDKVRPVVTRHPNLIRSLASMHVIPLAAPSLRVLALERSPHEHRAAEQEQRHVSEHGGVAGVVARLLVLEEDVGGDHTVAVAGADDDADDDAALVDAFDIVAAPGEGVGAVCGIWLVM